MLIKGGSPTTPGLHLFSSSIPFMHFLFYRIFSVKTCMRNDSIAYFISFLLSQNLTRFAASCFLDPQEQSALEELWVMCPARLCQAQLREQSHLGWLSTTVKIGYRVEEACKEFSKIQDKCHMSENSDASERQGAFKEILQVFKPGKLTPCFSIDFSGGCLLNCTSK